MTTSVTPNCNIQPACLPNPSMANYPTSTNIDVWAAGWGALAEDQSGPDKLYNVKMTLYSSNYCNKVPGTKDWNKQICAGI